MPALSELRLPLYDVHLSQIAAGRPHHSLPAEGVVDLASVCQSLSAYGYDGLVVLEIRDHMEESKALPEKVCAAVSEAKAD